LSLERLAAEQQKELGKGRVPLEASPEEVKGSRFSPRLIGTLRKRLGVTQKEMALLAGVTVGAIYQWEKGIFEPRGKKKGVLVALRRLGRKDVKKLLEGKKAEKKERKVSAGRGAKGKKVRRRKARGRRAERK